MSDIGNVNSFSLFISDLHLCHTRPAITAQFIAFLASTAKDAEALYILGDFFEYWAGDDDIADAHHQHIIGALKGLSSSGTKIFFMHGNRDFLIADIFAASAGLTLLPDPTLLEVYGKRILLSHGDTLCTDDLDYQAFRKQVRAPAWQKAFLDQPLATRKAQIEALRQRSESEKSYKNESIMDVNPDAVHTLLRDFDYPEILIHGHTHRPALHQLTYDGHTSERWVLGDWYEQGSCLRLDKTGCKNIAI
ncbi:UDP-2,3-diacylglucosamine diphosphatase [Methylovorus sp. MM2]|uniref:UDP-2,3-diacylglucosamine diphosphatase n=1 Tax=Methylovorus sp. MM2 TaxID=1848038 RepID=UPI0007DF92EC|nr:UDP-2,3-diacylglucosamine diphosphatase [Methylovorus sp. MM2]OAM51548.1 UDP-2,3-diacylglucosamine diphosphatase [Methylovorus sp. MM2]